LPKAEKTLLGLKKNDYLSLVITFNLSNTYKLKKDYDSAINLMSEYINDLRAANTEELTATNVKADNLDELYAVALYNRACYTTKKAFSSGRDDVLIGKALDDLKKSVDLDPESKEYAWEDTDFKGLKDERNARFAEIVGREYPELTGGTLVKA
jgi:hypothetical protein